MADRETLVKDFFTSLFKELNEAWVRKELAKLETGVEIRLDELEYALEYTYKLAYDQKQYRVKNKMKIRGETRWAAPQTLKKSGVFKRAAIAALARGRNYVRKQNLPLDPRDTGPSGDVLAFYTPNLQRNFFRELKTGGLDVLESALKEKSQRITTVKYLADTQGYTPAEAKELNENWALRRNIHITHQGWTTSGAALGATAIQATSKLLEAHNIPRIDFSQFFKDIVGVFEVKPLDGQIRVAAKGQKRINVRAGAGSLNQKNKEAGDLSEYKEDFIKIMLKAFEGVPDEVLMEMVGLEPAQLAENIGILITKNIVKKLTSRQITSRVGLLKWAKASGISVPRGINRATYAGSRAKLRKSPIYSEKEEDQSFNELASLRAQKLYMALKVNLRDHVVMNMRHAGPEAPADPSGPLTYRTGRFADSVRVEQVKTGKDLLPVVKYDYMRNPYQVFERGHPKYRPTWDPYTNLISKSIREIAKQIEIEGLRVPRVGSL